ncbi:ParA family protein [Salinirubellus sp. GCM10025818]|uniref:ParA family protein n=1 Tax=Salinirubellus TaxID=2162630 RepID=UPI0030D3E340
MLSYTVYSEAGGVGKTTLSANLAVAHRRAGLDVLVVPLDPQDGDLSHLFAVDDDRSTEGIDHLVRHLIGRGKGDFYDLVRTAEGVDIIPEHNILEDLDAVLQEEQSQRDRMGDSFNRFTRLLHVLKENRVQERYDVLVVDPPASTGPHLYNALTATRNLVLPIEPSGKGQASVAGMDDLVGNLEEQLDINIGVLAAVPNGVKGTRDQADIIAEIESRGFEVPVVIGDRTSLLEGCWRTQCSAYRYVREHRSRRRDYELETLAQLDELARFLESQGGIEAPNPPEPGDVDHDVEVAP